MPIRKPKPTSPGPPLRHLSRLRRGHRSRAGEVPHRGPDEVRRAQLHGRKTSRHRGGGAKRLYRKIDFKRRKDGVPAKVAAIEYDPNRSAYIALLHYADGEKRYILAPQRLRVGMTLSPGPRRHPRRQLRCRWRNMPTGTVVHNVELEPGRGGQLGRSAGTAIQLMAKEATWRRCACPRARCGLVRADCRATVGTIGNADHQNVKIGKAGRKRHMGVRPQTRGTAMNPVDHPHGGGEGSTTPGRHPVTPWGVPTLGLPHPQEEQAVRPVHRARPQTREEAERAMSRSSKKGPSSRSA